MPERVFGHVPGVRIGSVFPDRASLSKAGVHRPTQAGISGAAAEGADSIVLSGGYEDDLDLGSEIIYTGHGGQDPNTRRQIADQELTRQNRALAVSAQEGLPVRVVRGANHISAFSPDSGYQYVGLYRVEEYWHEKGQSGFNVWRFRLVQEEVPHIGTQSAEDILGDLGKQRPERTKTTVTRIIRDTALSRQVKKLHNYHCQVCGTRLEGPAGPYAEGAHIRPLGNPHNGPDTLDNLLCLCPNHHLLFDIGAFTVGEDWNLIGTVGELRRHARHKISQDALRYHREHFGLLK